MFQKIYKRICKYGINKLNVKKWKLNVLHFREDLMKAVFHPNRLKKLGVFNVNSIEID
jgi:hypothetical protein